MTHDILTRSAVDLVSQMARGDVSAVELMRATLLRINQVNPVVNAIVSLRDADQLMAEALKADETPIDQRGPLHGLPLAVKDLAAVKGLPTTMGSQAVSHAPAKADELMVARMRAAGAIFVGKTNVPEFGLGSHTFNPVFGTTLNPYDTGRSAGGSSGGAAVALATGMMTLADGSDMMGSLRNPAAWNNVYGFRPTVGRVPGDPVGNIFQTPLATLGPMARNPRDIARLLSVQSGPVPHAPNSLEKFELGSFKAASLKGIKIGWTRDWGSALSFEPGILDLCEKALEQFKDMGAEVIALDPPYSREALWESWMLLRAHANASRLSILMENPKTRDLIKEDALWEVETGLRLSAMDIERMQMIASDWFRTSAKLFQEFDALIMPTAQVWPFPKDESKPMKINSTQMDTYHRWMETVIPVSLIGLPSLNIPIGFGKNELPMGMQVVGPFGADRRVLEIGGTWHQATDWPNKKPPQS